MLREHGNQKLSRWRTGTERSLIAGILGLVSCTPLPKLSDSSCDTDADCRGGELCIENRCGSARDQSQTAQGSEQAAGASGNAMIASLAGASGSASPTQSAPASDAGTSIDASPAAGTGAAAMSDASMSDMGSAAPRCTNDTCPNGTCEDLGNDYRCSCNSGYENADDKHCRLPVNDCPPDACKPGMCMDLYQDYMCTCPSGFIAMGTKACAEACPVDACKPGGTCVVLRKGWACSCEVTNDDERSCPDVLRGNGIFDTETMLQWYDGATFGTIKIPPTADDATRASLTCSVDLGGYRWATKSELESIPFRLTQYGPNDCTYTPQGLVCPPQGDLNNPNVKLYCVQ